MKCLVLEMTLTKKKISKDDLEAEKQDEKVEAIKVKR